MEGTGLANKETQGLIPRSMKRIFEMIREEPNTTEFTLKCFMLEIYNEKINDLLVPNKCNLQIKEDRNKGIYVQDASEIYVNSAEEMFSVLQKGASQRTIAATSMNERSSRSHSMFGFNLSQRDTRTDTLTQSKLYFVDLAGSEKIAKTNVKGAQLEEAKNINKSLTTLGMVINSLAEGKNAFVPYRDSKLTRLLQESLGGNSQTTLFLACSMCSYNDKETVGTLRFGSRAKAIKTKPVANVQKSSKELQLQLDIANEKLVQQESLIMALKTQLEASSTQKRQPSPIPEKPSGSPNAFFAEDVATLKEKEKSASLSILKLHIQASSLNEEIRRLKANNIKLENELALKENTIQELKEKLTMASEMSRKSLRTQAQQFKLFVEKIQLGTQEKLMHFNKIGNEIGLVQTDFERILTDYQDEESGEDNNEFFGVIKRFISQLEDFQGSIKGLRENLLHNEEIQEFSESISHRSGRSQQMGMASHSDRRDSESAMSNESPGDRIASEFESTQENEERGSNEQAMARAHYETILEDFARENMGSFVDTQGAPQKKKSGSMIDIPELETLLSNNEPRDEISAELTNLINVQRNTIEMLNETNDGLAKDLGLLRAKLNAKAVKYRKKLMEMQKSHLERTKDLERKVEHASRRMSLKIQEINEVKRRLEEALQSKSRLLDEAKITIDRYEKIIDGNKTWKSQNQLEQKLNGLIKEKQELFGENYQLKVKINDFEETISEKKTQIEMLQKDINKLAEENEQLKKKIKESQNQKKAKEERKEEEFQEALLVDRNIVKPICGERRDSKDISIGILSPSGVGPKVSPRKSFTKQNKKLLNKTMEISASQFNIDEHNLQIIRERQVSVLSRASSSSLKGLLSANSLENSETSKEKSMNEKHLTCLSSKKTKDTTEPVFNFFGHSKD